nr:uncharacterized protein LOC113808463 [Penaeus vannamei]
MVEVDFRCSRSGLLCLCWMGTKPVTMLSTVQVSRLQAQSRWMKGVDLGDQLAASYPSVRKSLKWYNNLFFNMYDLAVINTFSIYKFLGHGRVDQAGFRMDLAIDIINHYVQQREPHSTRGRHQHSHYLLVLQGGRAILCWRFLARNTGAASCVTEPAK